MKSNIYKLGEFLALVENRNTDLSITNLQGVSISKEFMPSIANIVGTDLSSYKIVRTGQFAYGPVTSRNGDKISIARLTSDDCIISSSYTPFEVTRPDILDPDYLMLWFMRPEFDRYARYMSNGSAREVFDWDCMCNVDIPVPPIEEQRKIVRQYKVITERVELLTKKKSLLDSLLDTIYKNMFIDNAKDAWHQGILGELIDVRYGKDYKDFASGMIPLYGSGGIMKYVNKSIYNGETVLIPRIGSLNNIVYENGPFWTVNTMFYTIMKMKNLAKYVYLSIRNIDFLHLTTGSAVPRNTSEEIIKTKILIPDADTLDIFERKVTPIFENLKDINSEIKCLKSLSTALLCKIHGE